MKKIAVANLGLIITERCNLNCNHCLMGGCTNKVMSDEVIEATLSQFKYIMNLSVCGGEPTLALDRIEKIFSYVIENKIVVDHVSITINGTIYSETFLNLLKYMENGINSRGNTLYKTNFRISYDKYHIEEIERLNLVEKYVENVKKYRESPYYRGLVQLGKRVIREGNAVNLDPKITVPFRPYKMMMTYVGNNNKLDILNGFCYIGPFITVNVDGIVTECDASNQHQVELYNYGNVLCDSIEDVCLNQKPLILKPRRWSRVVNREVIKYSKELR